MTQAQAVRQGWRELTGYVRRAARVRHVTLDGVRIQVEYERWSPLLIRRVLAGRYEVEERKLIPRVIAAGDRVLEIGGGVGLIAMLCARVTGPSNVFVYEANPEILAAARDNFRHNELDISIEHAAVVPAGHSGDHVTFFVSENFWSSSLLDKGGAQRAISAPALPLGSLVAKHRPTVIIMDVEGAEYELLRSADLSGVDKLCIEFHTRYIGAEKVSALIHSLLDRGFVLQLEQSIGEVLYFSRSAR